MLILTRKRGESIILNGHIEIKIVEIEDGKVSIGIEAPKDVEIFRKEIYDSIQEENVKASKQIIDMNEVNQLLKKNK